MTNIPPPPPPPPPQHHPPGFIFFIFGGGGGGSRAIPRNCSPLAQVRREQKKPGSLILVYFMDPGLGILDLGSGGQKGTKSRISDSGSGSATLFRGMGGIIKLYHAFYLTERRRFSDFTGEHKEYWEKKGWAISCSAWVHVKAYMVRLARGRVAQQASSRYQPIWYRTERCYFYIVSLMLWIRIGFSADSRFNFLGDPNPNPDPGSQNQCGSMRVRILVRLSLRKK
jgi:hypothetical protein